MLSVLQLIQMLIYKVVQWIHPFFVPICFVLAWSMVAIGGWTIWSAVRDSVSRARRMHQIPCAGCRYFSGNYALKCPVHPYEALSEAAIGCPDFESVVKEVPVLSR